MQEVQEAFAVGALWWAGAAAALGLAVGENRPGWGWQPHVGYIWMSVSAIILHLAVRT